MTDHFERDRLHHEAIAHEYDRVVVQPRVVGNDRLFRKFRRFIRPGSAMLDAATGTGHLLFRLADKFDQVVAVDHSAAMLKVAQQKTAEKGWNHISFVCRDIRQFLSESANDRFDLITCVGFLHHVEAKDVAGVVRDLARLLRVGGVLLVSEPVKIEVTAVPPRLNDWNRRSLAAKTHYTVSIDDPDEEPLDSELLLRAFHEAGLVLLKVQRSFEVFPHNEPPSLFDRLAIFAFNATYGSSGNVFTLAARKPSVA